MHVCEVEGDEEGIVDVVLDDNTLRAVPRPGTSLRTPTAATPQQQGAVSQAFRYRQIFLANIFLTVHVAPPDPAASPGGP